MWFRKKKITWKRDGKGSGVCHGGFLLARFCWLTSDKISQIINSRCLGMCRLTFSTSLDNWQGMFFSQKSLSKVASFPNNFKNFHKTSSMCSDFLLQCQLLPVLWNYAKFEIKRMYILLQLKHLKQNEYTA